MGHLFLIQERELFRHTPLLPNYTYSFDTPFEEYFLETANQGKINLLHFRAPNPKGLILYYHGRGGNLAKPWGRRAQDFLQHNYDVIMMDYRGFGKSEGPKSHQNMLADALECYDFGKKLLKKGSFYVYGCSLGSGVATYVASKRDPNMLILESPYFNMIDLACNVKPYLPNFLAKIIVRYPFYTDQWIQKVSCPLVLFHTVQDRLIPYDSSVRLLKNAKGPSKLLSIEEGGHFDITKTSQYKIFLKNIL